MSTTYLFDWGDTLMVDFPNQSGKMREWPLVRAIEGTHQVLEYLSSKHKIYVATNAADSSEADIQAAFKRVGLAPFISGYFGRFNLGVGKSDAGFYVKIAERLQVKTHQLIMIGDNVDKDVLPAIEAGVKAIWYNPANIAAPENLTVKQVNKLSELIE